MPTDALASYGITDTPIGNGNNQSNRKTITIPSGKHIVFKLPTRFSTMVTDDTNPVVDYSNTGYSYNPYCFISFSLKSRNLKIEWSDPFTLFS